jgi:hypothetical protein
MRRLLLACLASVLLYGAAFAFVLDRPLALGTLRREIDARLAIGAALPSPKLVILAGSNGPYSHRCEIIGPMLGLPCVNGGVALGIGLDYLFARWEPELKPGDIVYLPMETAQYTVGRLASMLGPDAAMMLRHDRATLAELPPRRWLAALFSADLRAAVMSVTEMAAAPFDPERLRAAVVGRSNAWGDHVGHTAALAAANRAILAAAVRREPPADAIEAGYGAREIARFVRWSGAHRVLAIGGLPTGFDDVTLPPATIAAIRAVYLDANGRFLLLANHSRYPRADFFDTPDHLDEPCQIAHSLRVAAGLAPLLGRALRPAPRLARAAAACGHAPGAPEMAFSAAPPLAPRSPRDAASIP